MKKFLRKACTAVILHLIVFTMFSLPFIAYYMWINDFPTWLVTFDVAAGPDKCANVLLLPGVALVELILLLWFVIVVPPPPKFPNY